MCTLVFSGCSAKYLLDFLRSTTCDYLYLVGDIIDFRQMKKKITGRSHTMTS